MLVGRVLVGRVDRGVVLVWADLGRALAQLVLEARGSVAGSRSQVCEAGHCAASGRGDLGGRRGRLASAKGIVRRRRRRREAAALGVRFPRVVRHWQGIRACEYARPGGELVQGRKLAGHSVPDQSRDHRDEAAGHACNHPCPDLLVVPCCSYGAGSVDCLGDDHNDLHADREQSHDHGGAQWAKQGGHDSVHFRPIRCGALFHDPGGHRLLDALANTWVFRRLVLLSSAKARSAQREVHFQLGWD
mmetsp:Transcript_29178/g.88298  ORF Transcript_29178/g.88298 Transcript_29178/m.88298 type:complete len:246 (+) Transcript_29178:1066-1803(+)